MTVLTNSKIIPFEEFFFARCKLRRESKNEKTKLDRKNK